MGVLAQIPGADEAIKSAAGEGWVTVLFVVIVLSVLVTFGYVVRQVMKEARERECEANVRLEKLEDFIRGQMLDALRGTAVAMEKMLGAAQSICDAAAEMSSAIAHCRLSQERVEHD